MVKTSLLSQKTTHIGSLPFKDPEKAVELVLEFVDIPAWPQLSRIKNESMVIQFNEGLPGFDLNKEIIDTSSPEFENELMELYENYLKVVDEGNTEVLKKFSISEEYARGFKIFLQKAKNLNFSVVKGQVTGPFTLATALKTENKEISLFREDLRDMITKFLTLKALCQALELKKISPKVIIFFDEPGLSGFGSSTFITISKEDVVSTLNEIAEVMSKYEILTGVHVCANTSWDIVLESEINIVSFDSFNFYDKLVIYKDHLKKFFESENKYLAWGVIPTNSDELENIGFEEIFSKFNSQLDYLSSILNISKDSILEKSLFTPACGLGSLKESLAIKALELLRELKYHIIKGG